MLFVLLCTSLLGVTHAGQLCMKCLYVADPKDCYTVTQCGDHEECSLMEYVMPGGGVLYDVGCMGTQKCRAAAGRREVYSDGRYVTCTECCNGTKACNIGGMCSATPINRHGGNLCFNCDQTLAPSTCSRIKLCDQDQVCYVGQKTTDIEGTRIWEAKCALPSSECPLGVQTYSAAQVFGKRFLAPHSRVSSGAFCFHCCRGDFCNNECSLNHMPQPTQRTTTPAPPSTTIPTTPVPTTQPTTPAQFKPKITNIGGTHSVRIGTDVRLFCSAIGNPTPHNWWNALQSDSSVSNFHIEGNGHILVIENYQRKNDGQYMCYATNSLGKDEKIITLRAP